MHRLCLMALVAPILSACGTDPDDFGRCSGGLRLTVSPAAQPEFAWTPSDCLVNEVAVDGASGPLWSLYNPDPVNRIESPVRYGQAASSGESQSPGPGPGGPVLTPGTRYVVSLRRIENGFVTVAGEQAFHHQSEPDAPAGWSAGHTESHREDRCPTCRAP